MAKSAAERQRERRAKIRKDAEAYTLYKLADVNRKRKRREEMSEREIRILQNRTKKATRKWRAITVQNKKACVSNEDTEVDVYTSPDAMRMAKRRVERVLPKSPRKKRAVMTKLISNLLKKKNNEVRKPREDPLSQKVRQFYECDSISRVMPGKADVIVVRENGVKETKQKRHMIMTLKETYEQFQIDHPSCNIGKSKFAQLRPQHVLLSSQMPRNVCGCKYHNNIILLTESLHQRYPEIVPVYSKDGFLSLCVCDINSEECMSSSCEKCIDGILFHANCVTKMNPGNSIKWYQWVEDDKGYLTKRQEEGSIEDACKLLKSQLPKFLWHVYVKNKQAAAYEADKLCAQESSSSVAVLQMDFAENFTATSQDEIQSAHV